jgi:hypothetical protein
MNVIPLQQIIAGLRYIQLENKRQQGGDSDKSSRRNPTTRNVVKAADASEQQVWSGCGALARSFLPPNMDIARFFYCQILL